MDNYKSFLQSRTIWGALLAVVGAVMNGAGFDTGSLNGLDGEIVTIVGGALAAYGRVKAVKKLK
jgi:hypothetical protein